MAVRHVDLRIRVRRSPDLMLRPRRRLDAGCDRYAVQALRRHSDRIHRHRPAPRRSRAGRVHRRVAFGSPRARRPRPEQGNAPGLASLVRPSGGRPPLRLDPSADRFPDGRRGDGPCVLLSALFARVRRAGGREGSGAGEESRRADVGRLEHPLAFDAILDEPRDRGARRELSRQHRLRPPLPAAARKTVGPRRRRGLRRRRALAHSRTGTPTPGGS